MSYTRRLNIFVNIFKLSTNVQYNSELFQKKKENVPLLVFAALRSGRCSQLASVFIIILFFPLLAWVPTDRHLNYTVKRLL